MRRVAPEGPVYQAGTLSGNPVAMAAALATLRETDHPGFYDALERRTARLVEGLRNTAKQRQVAVTAGHAGSLWGLYFTAGGGGAGGHHHQGQRGGKGPFGGGGPGPPPPRGLFPPAPLPTPVGPACAYRPRNCL